MHATPDTAFKRPPHELLLEILRQDDSAVPRSLVIHPLRTVYNREAIVPPMCYTRTEGRHNPCYVCHQDQIPGRPNAMNDGDLQEAYSFSDVGRTNQWHNLFADRRRAVAAISDRDILTWVAQDNYSELAGRLRAQQFRGYVPDLSNLHQGAAAFDAEGFARDGSHWVAFNYKPLPSTFWPTNGAMDDVMIRLPAAFRTTPSGKYSRDVYKANLALLEANIKGLDAVTVRSLDERAVGEDLDGDGSLGVINRVTKTGGYMGAARGWFSLPHVYPLDTEFLHSVRYVGVDGEGRVHVPPRMKELRYMRKRFMLTGPRIRELESIANVAHEGLRFSADEKTLYFVDEWNSGSIYKFVLARRGDYTKGQTFVLKVDAYNGNPADDYNQPSNASAPRVGPATWIALTDWAGKPLTAVDPFRNGPTNDPRTNSNTRGGRPAADEVGGTPYGRPEDIEVGKLKNGREVVFFAATSENSIYSIEIVSHTKAIVRLAASQATPKNLGFLPTSGVMDAPDNLAQDALGNIYIIEDNPNGSRVGGDIWFMRDANDDGVAESIDHFLTLQVAGSEATGMVFNPAKPTEFVVAVQHPTSVDPAAVPGGVGDGIWQFDLRHVAAPPCKPLSVDHEKDAGDWFNDRWQKVCYSGGSNFVKRLEKAHSDSKKGNR